MLYNIPCTLRCVLGVLSVWHCLYFVRRILVLPHIAECTINLTQYCSGVLYRSCYTVPHISHTLFLLYLYVCVCLQLLIVLG